MPQTSLQDRDPIRALYKSLGVLSTQVRSLAGKKATISVRGSQVLQDGDGAVWIDNDDNKIHYIVNGNERTIAHE